MVSTNKPVSDNKLSADLKTTLAHWIASSGSSVVEDDELLQNQAYNLPSRRTIDAVIAEMYKEKLAEHKKVVESIRSIAFDLNFLEFEQQQILLWSNGTLDWLRLETEISSIRSLTCR